MTLDLIRPGRRVVLKHDVDRFPFALIPAGSAGTVTIADGELTAVKMDNHFPGLREWDNAVEWYDFTCDDTLPEDSRLGLLQDVLVIA